MATNEKWIPPPYQGGQTEATENQTSGTIATQNTVVIDALDDLQVSNYGEDGSGDLRIVLIGKTGTGKSATGNTLVGEDVFQFRGSSKSVTTKCTVVQKRRFGKTLVAVDTPGFLDTNMSSEKLREELVSCTCFTYPGVHAFLLLFQVGHRYIDEDQRAIESIKDLFCENFVNHTVVVFTGEDTLYADKQTLKDYISELPEKLKEMIASCKGGVIAISNRGQHYEREQAAKKLIRKVEEVVRRNGGKRQYYTTLLSVEISKMIAENIKEILKANVEVYDKIRLIKQKMKTLSGEVSRIKEFEKTIDGLMKGLIDEHTAQATAVANIQDKLSKVEVVAQVGAVAGVAGSILSLIALILK